MGDGSRQPPGRRRPVRAGQATRPQRRRGRRGHQDHQCPPRRQADPQADARAARQHDRPGHPLREGSPGGPRPVPQPAGAGGEPHARAGREQMCPSRTTSSATSGSAWPSRSSASAPWSMTWNGRPIACSPPTPTPPTTCSSGRLQSIRDNVDLSPQTRGNLLSRLEGAVAHHRHPAAPASSRTCRTAAGHRPRRRGSGPHWPSASAPRSRSIRRMKAFDELMDQGRFNEAYREALVMQQDTINRGQEVDKTMVAAYHMGLTGTHLREVQEIKRASEERYLLTMLQVDKSHIPFPDEPPVEFPPAATWQKLTERRLKAGYDSAGLGEDQEGRLRAQEIQSKLKRPGQSRQGHRPQHAAEGRPGVPQRPLRHDHHHR